MKTSEVLNATADELDRNGWMNPTRSSPGPNPTCAQVAIGRVVQGRARDAAERALYTYLGGTGLTEIWHWNDAPERTATEVVEALRAAAVIAAARESETQPAPVAVS